MDQKIVLNKLVNSWNVTPHLPRAILLMGSNNIGRTTFAELIRKYVNNVQDDKLIFDNGKYNKENVISNKILKVQTIYPAVYEKSSDQEQLKILDLPTLVFAPENKKWSQMDQKITIQNLAIKMGKVGFLLFINQGATKNNVLPWKKSLISFLDLFKIESLRDELLDSVAMIFTKASTKPTDNITNETMAKRLQLFRGTLQKQKGIDLRLVDQLFKNLIEKKRLLVFKKVTNDENQRLEVIQNWKILENLANCSLSKQMIKQIPLTPEGQKSLQDYFSTVTSTALQYISNTTKGLFQAEIFTIDKLREVKNMNQLEGQQIQIKKSIKSIFEQTIRKPINYIQFIEKYASLSSSFRKIDQENFIQLLQQIIKTGLFRDIEDQAPFQLAIEGLELRKLLNFTAFSLENHIQNFKQLFTDQTKEAVFKKLMLPEGASQKKEYINRVLDLLDKNFQQLPNSLAQFHADCKKKLIKFSNPREALKIYIEQLDKHKNPEKIMQTACDIGQVLEGKKLFRLAGNIYRQAKQPYKAMKCLKQAVHDERSAEQYVEYLIEIGLFEQATKSCYELQAQLGIKSRTTFGQCLKNILDKRQKGLLKNLFQENPDNKNLNQIKKIVQEAFQKI